MATLVATPATIQPGGTVKLSWTWISGGYVRITRPSGVRYSLPSTGTGTSSYTPRDPGTYRADLVTTSRRTKVLASTTFTVGTLVSLPADAVRRAGENGSLVLATAGQVWYGAGSQWAVGTFPAGQMIACNNDTFGDPAPNIEKACYAVPTPTVPGTIRVSDIGTARSEVVILTRPSSGAVLTDQPAGTLQALINGTSAGATLSVPLGIYHEAVTVPVPMTINMTGSQLTGDNVRQTWVTIGANGVTWTGGWFQNAQIGASQTGSFLINGRTNFTGNGIRMTNGAATLLRMQNGSGHTFNDCEFEQARESFYSVNLVNNFAFYRCKFHDALGTLPGFNPGNEGGVGKFGGYVGESPTAANPPGSNGALFEDCEAYNIVGFGFWSDVQGNNATWRRCRIYNVQGAGIFYEVSDTVLIENCVIYGCGRTNPAWGYGAAITLSSSRNCTVRNNLIYDSFHGIDFLSQTRLAANGWNYNFGITNNQAYGNTIIAKNATDFYLMGFFRDWADPAFDNGTNRAFGNMYWSPGAEPQNGRFYKDRPGAPYNGDYSTLASYMSSFSPVDTTSVYLTTPQKDAALAAAGVPA